MDSNLIEYLLKEEAHAFKGWDFSYLDGRCKCEPLPWSYEDLVRKYLKKTDVLLDLGTGDGVFLQKFNHPYILTSVTESYLPNIKLCMETLKPKGITVFPTKNSILDNISSNTFDIVLSRHESFSESQVNRVLKSKGIFITQQVGSRNNYDLATFFDKDHKSSFPEMTLRKTIKRLKKAGFTIIFKAEAFTKNKFLDLGAIAYYAKIISWEFKNFSVSSNLDKFNYLKKKLERKKYIESTEHRFMIIAQKN